ncbi:septation protein IspZ [Parasphingorhabdus sp.]|jgi:intracellular septation protein|uniref:septation protein IspZ n=1 Tax=Parasphingorhabdus sp. TaxID=2709688 RepID=UPI0007F41F5B|nr:septation protein IspZ [Sphingomonadales bacterium EhC05]
MTENTAIEEIPKEHRGLNFALDFGPLLIFFLVYKFGAPEGNPITAALYGTAAFMVAIVIAMIVSKWKLGKISPMMWMSAVLILGFGALTLYFNDPRFIQHKPTIIYAAFALILFGGLLRGKAMLKYLLEAAFEGLSDEGWLKLSRNWALFFTAMAIANELMVALLSFDTWLTIKVWGVTAASFIFAMANIPMLMKHGFAIEDDTEKTAP